MALRELSLWGLRRRRHWSWVPPPEKLPFIYLSQLLAGEMYFLSVIFLMEWQMALRERSL